MMLRSPIFNIILNAKLVTNSCMNPLFDVLFIIGLSIGNNMKRIMLICIDSANKYINTDNLYFFLIYNKNEKVPIYIAVHCLNILSSLLNIFDTVKNNNI